MFKYNPPDLEIKHEKRLIKQLKTNNSSIGFFVFFVFFFDDFER